MFLLKTQDVISVATLSAAHLIHGFILSMLQDVISYFVVHVVENCGAFGGKPDQRHPNYTRISNACNHILSRYALRICRARRRASFL